jgi:hypothetical protein
MGECIAYATSSFRDDTLIHHSSAGYTPCGEVGIKGIALTLLLMAADWHREVQLLQPD